MLKASPSGADKIQSFPDLRQMLLYAAGGGIVLAALFAPWLTDVSPLDQDLMNLDQPFSPAHPLGTDSLGRDILARLVYGARTTLEISLGGTFIAFFIGAGIGLDLAEVYIEDAFLKLGEITGQTAGEEVLDHVFSKFCIGK